MVLAAGVLGRNTLVVAAAASLIAVATLGLSSLVPMMEKYSVNIGLTLLIVGLLAPFASGRLTFQDVAQGLKGVTGLLSVAGGALAAYMCGRGLQLLEFEPEVIIGLVAGTMVGVAFLRGIPVGPLAAAGITAMFLELARLWKGGG